MANEKDYTQEFMDIWNNTPSSSPNPQAEDEYYEGNRIPFLLNEELKTVQTSSPTPQPSVTASPERPIQQRPSSTSQIDELNIPESTEKSVFPRERTYEDRLGEAEKESGRIQLLDGILRGVSQIGSGVIGSGAKIEHTPLDHKAPIERLDRLKKSKDADFDLNLKKALQDPNSPISQAARERAIKIFPQLSKKDGFNNLNAEQLMKLGIKLDTDKTGMSDYQRLALELRARQLDQGDIREVRLKDTAKWKKDEAEELTPKQVEEVLKIDNTLDQIEAIEGIKPLFDTGPIASRLASFRQAAGVDDAQRTAFKTQVGRLMVNYMRDISGAAIAEPEAQRLMSFIPNEKFSDEAFVEAMKKFKDEYETSRARKIYTYKIAGKSGADNLKNRTSRQELVKQTYPKIVFKGNEQTTVENESEEKEAKAEGWN